MNSVCTTNNDTWCIRFGGRGRGCLFFLKKMHKDTVEKKNASAYRSQKKYLQGNDANLHNKCKSR